MRKVIGVNSLITYLDSAGYSLSEEKIQELILKKSIPHQRPLSNIIVFHLDHIDSWIEQQRSHTND
ncbi:hypothetical protein [Peribacillus sp. SCS-155]|uniref:hypothetical protein n=1 Tax=Peribacillus sedimenti TaxID=3115297 RepID=UPI0039068FC9